MKGQENLDKKFCTECSITIPPAGHHTENDHKTPLSDVESI